MTSPHISPRRNVGSAPRAGVIWQRPFTQLKSSLILLSVLIGLMAGPIHSAPAPSPTVDPLPVYTDALASGWQDWSWGGITRRFDNTAPIHGGSASLAVAYTEGWSGLQLGHVGPVDVTGYDTFRFYIHGGAAGGQRVEVHVRSDDTEVVQTVTPQASTWVQVDVPLQELGSTPIATLWWFNATPGAQATFYLDDMAFIATGPPPPPQTLDGPALGVDAGADQHPISPYIYGMNFADEALAAELRLPVRRWGGNATTRYNWRNDTANRASDYFFENIPEANANPGALPDGSMADQFVGQNRRIGADTIMTVPLIGWTPKSREFACGFSVRKYGPQQSVDPYRPDCGNGVRPDGQTPVTGNDPADTSAPTDPSFVQDWIRHLIHCFGTAEQGGVRFYDLDNEPMLWPYTHRDVHPQPTSYDEMRDRTVQYAAAIKATDPTANTLGPVLWGWTAYFYSALDAAPGGAWWQNPQDRLAHGNTPFVEWYLRQMRAYEQANGIRILDYLDLHYYPQGEGVALRPAGDPRTQALRLRSTRSLWDPTYRDESWINEPVRLIPRLREWVDRNYPGTKLAITEYNWGALDHINGALAQADVLGIFGREGLDLATLWDPPRATQPGAFAFRTYRDYDGAGGTFGDVSVRAMSGDQGKLAIYAARRTSDGALTLMIINKTGDHLASTVTLSGFGPASTALVYRYSAANLNAVVREPDHAVGSSGFTATFPAMSITLVVLPRADQPGSTP